MRLDQDALEKADEKLNRHHREKLDKEQQTELKQREHARATVSVSYTIRNVYEVDTQFSGRKRFNVGSDVDPYAHIYAPVSPK